MSQDTVKNNKVLLLDDVKKLTGFSRSTIYRLIADGTFPKQFKRSERLVAWLESDIQTWLQNNKQYNNHNEITVSLNIKVNFNWKTLLKKFKNLFYFLIIFLN